MPKRERNKQFVEIEKKISTYLSVQGLSTEKAQIHFEEFGEIKSIIEREADQMQMSSAEFIRWLYLRWLSLRKKIPIEIEKRKHEYLTAADLEMTEEQCSIQIRKNEFYKKRHGKTWSVMARMIKSDTNNIESNVVTGEAVRYSVAKGTFNV